MKKLRKIVLFFISLLIFIPSLFILSGCEADPADVGAWYIKYIYRDETAYYPFTEFDGEMLYSDSWIWTFTEGGKVEIVALDGTKINGTYATKERDGRASLGVTVTLEDGKVFSGTCGRYMFDGVWYEFSLSDGEMTVVFQEEYRARLYTYQSYIAGSEWKESQERLQGKLPLEKRTNDEERFYFLKLSNWEEIRVLIVNEDYDGGFLTPQYVVLEAREEGVTIDFADGRRIEAAYVSYEWDAEEQFNVYYAETENGDVFKIYYRALAHTDEIHQLYVEDQTGDVLYILCTKTNFENNFSTRLPVEERSNVGDLFYLYSLTENESGNTFYAPTDENGPFGDYKGQTLTREYVTVELRNGGFTAVFSDGARIEADCTSYEWVKQYEVNVYTAVAENGDNYTVEYGGSFDRIDRIEVRDAQNDISYVLVTEYWLERLQ